jgi:hypothetical protein
VAATRGGQKVWAHPELGLRRWQMRRKALTHLERDLTPAQRLQAFVEHSELVGALERSRRSVEARPVRQKHQR